MIWRLVRIINSWCRLRNLKCRILLVSEAQKFTSSIWNLLPTRRGHPWNRYIHAWCIRQNVRLSRLLKAAHSLADAWMFSTCLVRTSGRAPNVMIDDLLPELHQGISQLLDSMCVSCPGGPVNNAIAFPVQEGLMDGSSMNLAVCRDLRLIPPLQPPHTIDDLPLYFALRRSGFLFLGANAFLLPLGSRWCKISHFLYVQTVFSLRDLIPLFIRV